MYNNDMCGRYKVEIKDSIKSNKLKDRIKKLNLSFAQGDIFPTNKVLCVIPKENRIDLSVMKWGIQKYSLLINARVENIDDRPTYKTIKNNRCAVIVNGFYEWDKKKNKYYISFDNEYMFLACIFNDEKELVILTKEAEDDFSHIHSRIPIIMNQEEMINYVHCIDKNITKKKLIIEQLFEEVKLF